MKKLTLTVLFLLVPFVVGCGSDNITNNNECDPMCEEGLVCENGQCVETIECRVDKDCPNNSVCLDNLCVDNPDCYEDEDCPGNDLCDRGTCVPYISLDPCNGKGCGNDPLSSCNECGELTICYKDVCEDACKVRTELYTLENNKACEQYPTCEYCTCWYTFRDTWGWEDCPENWYYGYFECDYEQTKRDATHLNWVDQLETHHVFFDEECL